MHLHLIGDGDSSAVALLVASQKAKASASDGIGHWPTARRAKHFSSSDLSFGSHSVSQWATERVSSTRVPAKALPQHLGIFAGQDFVLSTFTGTFFRCRMLSFNSHDALL